jgi:hypothetical protein
LPAPSAQYVQSELAATAHDQAMALADGDLERAQHRSSRRDFWQPLFLWPTREAGVHQPFKIRPLILFWLTMGRRSMPVDTQIGASRRYRPNSETTVKTELTILEFIL